MPISNAADLGKSILEALCQARLPERADPEQTRACLSLALNWNHPQVAQRQVFGGDSFRRLRVSRNGEK